MSFVVTRENVMDCLLMVANDELEIDKVRFSDDFQIYIKIDGSRWTGNVNYFVAQYVVKLQKDIVKIHNTLFPNDAISIKGLRNIDSNMLIDVHIEPGCTSIRAILNKILDEKIINISEKIMEKLTAKQIFTGVIVIASMYIGSDVVINATNKYANYHETISRLKSDEEVRLEQIKLDRVREINDAKTKELLIEQTAKSLEVASKYVDSFQFIRNSLGPGDTISAVKSNISVSHEELKGEKKDKADISAVYLDGKYVITGIDIKYNRLTISLPNDRTINASTELLSDAEKSFIHDMLKEGDLKEGALEEKLPSIGLHLTAKTKNGAIESIQVVELSDTPRLGAKTYADFAGVKQDKRTKSAANLPLSKLMGVPEQN